MAILGHKGGRESGGTDGRDWLFNQDSNILKGSGIPVTRWKGSEVDFVSVAHSLTPFSLSKSDDTLEVEHIVGNIEENKVKNLCALGPFLPYLM